MARIGWVKKDGPGYCEQWAESAARVSGVRPGSAYVPAEAAMIVGCLRVRALLRSLAWRPLGRVLIGCSAVVVCATLGLSGAQAAAAGAWGIQVAPKPSGAKRATLASVSCRSKTVCMAVGDVYSSAFSERWDGHQWSVQRAASKKHWSMSLSAVSCFSRTGCVAVGSATSRSDCGSELAEVWNGSQWSIQPTPDNSDCSVFGPQQSARLNDVSCVSARLCFAVGAAYGFASGAGALDNAFVERWNGRRWSMAALWNFALGPNIELTGISCVSASACTAVGAAAESGGGVIVRWDGKRWAIEKTGVGGDFGYLAGFSCAALNACAAVGATQDANGNDVPLVMQWTGTTWSGRRLGNAPAPYSDADLSGVSCPARASCMAVGSWSVYNANSAKGINSSLMMMRWSGSRWSNVAAPKRPSWKDSVLAGVSCSSAAACVAVGSYTNRTGHDLPLVESTIRPTPSRPGRG